MRHIAYPSTGQFSQIVKSVQQRARYVGKDENGDNIYDPSLPLPTLTFTGTVKLHGSFAGICFNAVDGFWVQSRENIITPLKDNAGFAAFVESKKEKFAAILHHIQLIHNLDYTKNTVMVAGEWAGCLVYGTPILLADGTNLPIGQIVQNKMDVEVMTYNLETGKLEGKRIINWFNNGSKDNWIRINIQRRRRGGRATGFVCTTNHNVFVNSQEGPIEKQAGDLTVVDRLLFPGEVLPYNARQFLMGSLLGDAFFGERRNIGISHSDDKQPYYNDFIVKLLGDIVVSTKNITSGHGSNMRVITTRVFPEIEDWYDELYKEGKKRPTKQYLDRLSPVALAAWYMDDGSLDSHNLEGRQEKCSLYVQGFGKECVREIKDWFDSRGYYCNLISEHTDTACAIRLTPEGTIAFMAVIAPYVIEEFNYKLTKRFRAFEKVRWWEHIVGEYDQALIPTRIDSIEPYTPAPNRGTVGFDLQIEGNSNYFANNTLVHNSGVQRSVAINNIPKSFFIFGVKVSPLDEAPAYWIDHSSIGSYPNDRIFNIVEFPSYSIDIDFANPTMSQNRIIEWTKEVEECCPIAKAFGFEGLGEGLVFSFTNDDGERISFKSKGLKHSNTKVKVLREVDEGKISNVRATAELCTPEWRLEQMLYETFDLNNGGVLDRKKLGDYIKAVIADIVKEDLEIITSAGLTLKEVGKTISDIARLYFFEQEKQLV